MRQKVPFFVPHQIRVLGALFLIYCNAALASDFQSPRTAALGGAGHASPLLNDAIYLNPSFVSFLPTSSFALNYTRLEGAGRNTNLSILDGRSELFQAGVGYTLQEDRRMIHFGGAKSFMEHYGVSFGGKFILPNGDAPQAIWDSSLSFTAIPGEFFQVALMLDNLKESEQARDAGFLREYILGTKFNFQNVVLVYFDPHLAPHADSRYGYELGLEFPCFNDVFLRAGQFKNSQLSAWNVRGEGYAFGLGWIAPKISFDFAIQRVTQPNQYRSATLGATIYF